MAGRVFSVIVHGDAEGPENVQRDLHDWLTDMELVPAGGPALLDRFIGYYEPYATSHDALDRDDSLMEETRNAARTLMEAVEQMRRGRRPAGSNLEEPRPK